ncbi:Hsp20/alpha crystallin family protein [Sphingobacterium sp. lm-10]|uniref:Hsp20/alpha crystallin family protein n=1 Tax=Sphingobacterium sp. lm-10 TaxID=2944904 RepID=UPI002021FE9C|nr:Hsp20/alpha crystallin family protein [Sphingobacterium sp. lm-10]MCL7986510.1 Hsp20/alpha crystallin family protein [Sphingobacterium sp. lm-10]
MALVKFPARNVNTDAVNPFVNNVFDSLFTDSFIGDRLVTRVPAVNIVESDSAFQLELAAPGLKKEDFAINVDKNLITISAEKQTTGEKSDKTYSKREFNYNSFSRSFTLPDVVNYNNIDANYVDGVLFVKIGKKEDAIVTKRSIEVM